MEQKTLGQVAFEAYWATGNPNTVARWETMHHHDKAAWEAGVNAVIVAHEARRWKAIAEAHEDYGQCVFINMEDADTPVCASTLDTDFTENCEWYGWTHFTPITLTTETAERLKAAIPAPPKEASDAE